MPFSHYIILYVMKWAVFQRKGPICSVQSNSGLLLHLEARSFSACFKGVSTTEMSVVVRSQPPQ